jgi:iron-sulfur cluster assembly protein
VEAEFPVALTEAAVAQVKKIQAKENKPGHFLRVGVKGGGCSGLEYVIRLDTKPTPYDQEVTLDGVKVVVDSKSAVYLQGTTIDWSPQLIGGGFQFENPNATRSCGCGTSFTPKTS